MALLEVHLAQDQVEALREDRTQAHLADPLAQVQVAVRQVQDQPKVRIVGLQEGRPAAQLAVLQEQVRIGVQTLEVQPEEALLHAALHKARR